MNVPALIGAATGEPCRPWPRHLLSRADWLALTAALAAPAAPSLLALWADTAYAHALLIDQATAAVLPVSVAVEGGTYPALSPTCAGAAWFERLVRDLWGHVAEGGIDDRPWLDHGRWPHTQPLSLRPGPPAGMDSLPEFVTLEGRALMQVPLGPVHGLIEEPAHLRLTTHGDTIRRAETRLGYAHKGILALLRGKSPRAAARFAARLSADATVAHAVAFARATEAALDVVLPPRAALLRMAMMEQERIAGHLDDLARMADEAGLGALHALAGTQRELLLRAQEQAFGHRLMMDCVVPGGLAADLPPEGSTAICRALDGITEILPDLRRRLDPLLTRLTGLGRVSRDTAQALAAGGIAGRASGRRFDARSLDAGYAPFGMARQIVEEHAGDAAARCRLRVAEIAESLRLVQAMLDALPEGAISIALPTVSGEGIGCVESPRGDVWHWLRLDHGQIAAAFPRDPGWAGWLLAEAALPGNPIEEVAMLRLSFGLPASALDL